MKRKLVVLLLILLTGYQYLGSHKPSAKSKLIEQTLNQVSKQLKAELDLRRSGDAVQAMNQIEMLGLFFNCYKITDVEEGRRILIHATDSLINAINNNEKIRPYLNQYPFTSENVDMSIYFYSSQNPRLFNKKIAAASCREGIIEYKRYLGEDQFFNTILRETYAEAVEKLKTNLNPLSSDL